MRWDEMKWGEMRRDETRRDKTRQTLFQVRYKEKITFADTAIIRLNGKSIAKHHVYYRRNTRGLWIPNMSQYMTYIYIYIDMHPYIHVRAQKTYIWIEVNIKTWLRADVTNKTFRAIPWFDHCFKDVGLIWCRQNIPNFRALAFERFKTVLGKVHFRSYQYKIVDHSDHACRRCFNYILILDLTSGFNGLGKDNYMTRRDAFKFGYLVWLIWEIWRYIVFSYMYLPKTLPVCLWIIQ